MKLFAKSHSIRFKLSLIFVLIVSALQLVFWVFSANVLESVMVYGSKMEIQNIAEAYREAQKNSSPFTVSDKQNLIDELSYTWDSNLTLVDYESGAVITTIRNKKMPEPPEVRRDYGLEVAESVKDKPIGKIYTIIRKDRQGLDALAIFVGNVGDHTVMISERPLNIIHDSTNLLTKYIVISGILTVSIGSLIILLLSKKLTQSIVEIEAHANRIAKLDFDQDNNIHQNDEIGSLGRAVNQISSELKSTIEALQVANSQLKDEIEQERKLERMRRLFVSSVSHELKTPISMIMGYADGLKVGVAKSPEQIEHYCNVIIDESEKMDQLIKDLLDMSAYQEGQLKIKKELFDLSELANRVTLQYKEQFALKDLNYQVAVRSHIQLNGDPLRIEQTLRNLIENALKYTCEGNAVEVTLSEVNEYAQISVYNNGKSIPEEELEAIWMCFYRGTEARNCLAEGFGVGLALVKEIVEQHGGQVQVVNEEKGVRFTVSLPLGV